MLAAGIRPVVLAYGAPTWARQVGWERPGSCRAAHGELCSYPPSRRHLSDWRAFIEAVTRQFPRMVALEVWNEPNLPRFFAPAPSPALYSLLLRAADRAARAAGATMPVLSGGLAAGTAEGGGIPAPRFLAGVYRAAGRASFDGIGTHPYPQGPPWVERMSANLDRLRRVRDRFHDRSTPLWITEVGVGGTSGRRPRGSVGLARQGPILVRMYRSTQGERRQGLPRLRAARDEDRGAQVRALWGRASEPSAEAGLLLPGAAPRRCSRLSLGPPLADHQLVALADVLAASLSVRLLEQHERCSERGRSSRTRRGAWSGSRTPR